MITIDLNFAELFVRNVDPSTRVVMAESVLLSFVSSGHRSGVKLKVFNAKEAIEEVKFTWTAGKWYGKDMPPDHRAKFQSQAAVAVGFLLAERIAGYQYAAHSARETGMDYWLKKEDPVLMSVLELSEPKVLHLAAHPEKLYDLSPRKYEELVAELLRVMGYDVFLTGQTRDGGRDIVAVLKGPTGNKLLTLVECKRNRRDRPIGIDVVQRFMWTEHERLVERLWKVGAVR